MSNIASDTRELAERMPAWRPTDSTTRGQQAPDSELLRIHALRLADAFDVMQKDDTRLRQALAALRGDADRAMRIIPWMPNQEATGDE